MVFVIGVERLMLLSYFIAGKLGYKITLQIPISLIKEGQGKRFLLRSMFQIGISGRDGTFTSQLLVREVSEFVIK